MLERDSSAVADVGAPRLIRVKDRRERAQATLLEPAVATCTRFLSRRHPRATDSRAAAQSADRRLESGPAGAPVKDRLGVLLCVRLGRKLRPAEVETDQGVEV